MHILGTRERHIAFSHAVVLNDGGIAMGGSPALLKSHPTVSMVSEVVQMTVGEEELKVDCSFLFRNNGPACKVRMGFPDRGYGALDPDFGEYTEDLMKSPPKTTFKSFRSWVDNQPVKTELIRSNKPGEYWHAKMVSFQANSEVRVRNVYTQEIGGSVAVMGKKHAVCSEVAYIVHTGSSWKGNIGRTEVIVTFRRKGMRGRLQALPVKQVSDRNSAFDIKWESVPINTIICQGEWLPSVHGTTLKFLKRNWRPTHADDLSLVFDYRVIEDETSPPL